MRPEIENRESVNRLYAMEVEQQGRWSRDCEIEMNLAIDELLHDNCFELIGRDCGPYHLRMSCGTRLGFHISTADGTLIVSHIISFTPLRRAITDYMAMYEAYSVAAGKQLDPFRLEAIDMARRAAHNDGAAILQERLDSKVRLDQDTARRLFTVVTVSRMHSVAVQRSHP